MARLAPVPKLASTRWSPVGSIAVLMSIHPNMSYAQVHPVWDDNKVYCLSQLRAVLFVSEQVVMDQVDSSRNYHPLLPIRVRTL